MTTKLFEDGSLIYGPVAPEKTSGSNPTKEAVAELFRAALESDGDIASICKKIIQIARELLGQSGSAVAESTRHQRRSSTLMESADQPIFKYRGGQLVVVDRRTGRKPNYLRRSSSPDRYVSLAESLGMEGSEMSKTSTDRAKALADSLREVEGCVTPGCYFSEPTREPSRSHPSSDGVKDLVEACR